MHKAEVFKLKPFFLSIKDAAAFLGISPKTISNELSTGTFPVKPIHRGTKPLFPYHALLEYAESLESDSSEPAKKRGRKPTRGTVVKMQSRAAGGAR